MLCQVCGKNDATVHFTKIINGNIEEIHLCSSCAKENKDLEFNFDFPFSFQKLFTGLIDSVQDKGEQEKDITCECGLTYKEFLESGKFGCAKCYDTFSGDMDSLLKGIHGHNRHEGKIPSGTKDKMLQKRAIESLKSELEQSIKIEDFERAAYLRDEIKKLREKTKDI